MMEFSGVVESVETIPSYNGLYDEVYLIVKREINGKTVRHVERTQDIITPEIQSQSWYVRDGLYYSAFEATEDVTLTLSGTSGEITATASANMFNDSSVGRRIRAVDADLNMLGELTITEFISATKVKGTTKSDFDGKSYQGGSWGVSVQNLSGLSHLEGNTVQILADGAVQSSRTVENGAILLEIDAFYIITGLGYVSYMQTMPFEGGSENGTSTGKRKRVNELSLRVWRTLGCSVGYDHEHMQKVKYRDPSTLLGTPQPLFTGIIPNVKYNQGWTWDASVTVEQSEPLPMNILAIAPIINEVDK
jgi:hypothetical protein